MSSLLFAVYAEKGERKLSIPAAMVFTYVHGIYGKWQVGIGALEQISKRAFTSIWVLRIVCTLIASASLKASDAHTWTPPDAHKIKAECANRPETISSVLCEIMT